MLDAFFGRFSKDIGIDLGTANTLVYVKDKGIVINEPSVVAINTRLDQIVAVGHEAKKMVGKTPMHLVASRPLQDGVISDFEVAEKMLKYFIQKVHRESFNISPRPRVVIGVPLDVTEVERKAVEDAAYSAGAREVMLIEEPMAAALGSRLPVRDPSAHFILDIGGGTSEIAVISFGGVVTWRSLRIAGDELTDAVSQYVRDNFSLLLGDHTAEEIKIKIGSAIPLDEPLEMKIRGRDLVSGLPREVIINDGQVRESLQKVIRLLVVNVKDTIEATPPELVAYIYEKGLYMSGGGAMLKHLDRMLADELGVPVQIVDDPLTAVVRGTGVILEDIEAGRDLMLPPTPRS